MKDVVLLLSILLLKIMHLSKTHLRRVGLGGSNVPSCTPDTLVLAIHWLYHPHSAILAHNGANWIKEGLIGVLNTMQPSSVLVMA